MRGLEEKVDREVMLLRWEKEKDRTRSEAENTLVPQHVPDIAGPLARC